MKSRAVWCIKVVALLALIILEVMGCYQFGSFSGELFLEEAVRYRAEPFFVWVTLLVSMVFGVLALACGIAAGFTFVKGVWVLRRDWRLIRIKSKVMRSIATPLLRRHSEDESDEEEAERRWAREILSSIKPP